MIDVEQQLLQISEEKSAIDKKFTEACDAFKAFKLQELLKSGLLKDFRWNWGDRFGDFWPSDRCSIVCYSAEIEEFLNSPHYFDYDRTFKGDNFVLCCEDAEIVLKFKTFEDMQSFVTENQIKVFTDFFEKLYEEQKTLYEETVQMAEIMGIKDKLKPANF